MIHRFALATIHRFALARAVRPIGLTFLVTALVTGCTRTAPEPLQVGHIAPESGTSKLGLHARWGVTLAVDEIDKSDALIQGRKVVVRHVDSRGSAEVAHADAVRLITLNRSIALLADTDAPGADQVGVAARPYGIPVISSRNITETGGNDTPFSLGIAAPYQGRVVARFVANGLQPKPDRVLVVYDESLARNIELVDGFRQELKGAAITIDSFPYSATPAIVHAQAEIQKSPPGAVLVVGATQEVLRELRSKQTASGSTQTSWLYAGEEFQVAALIADNPSLANDVYFATVFTSEGINDRGKEFAERYRKLSGQQEPDANAALAYEGALWLFETMRDSSALAPAQIEGALKQSDKFEGLTGTITLSHGHAVERPVFIVQMKGNELKLVKTDRGSKGS